jgi:predicted esterase
MTTSLSGYFVGPLSRRGRVVIAATEADAETNETTFPGVFAQVLNQGLTLAEHDVDKDGKLSLFDLYVVVAKEIAQSYASAEQLATEHQQLDDDGDGVGHEVQTPYLPEAQGGSPPGKKPSRPPRDGLLAARILLSSGPDDIADVPSEDLHADKDENKRYFLIGPGKDSQQPKEGYGLVVILPGGAGNADFQPFVKRIYKHAIPEGYLVAQPVAVKWTDKQVIVWPTEKNPAEEMKFSTEAFVSAVIKEIAAKHKIDSKKVFTLSWSSSGPAAYAVSLKDKTVTGSFIAMSVFKPKLLPPLEKAKGHAYYLFHSPEDKVCPYRMAEQAAKDLEANQAKVKLTTYEGGHGWRGELYENIRQGIEWLEKNSATAAAKE